LCRERRGANDSYTRITFKSNDRFGGFEEVIEQQPEKHSQRRTQPEKHNQRRDHHTAESKCHLLKFKISASMQ
jgi:hypothetical protein